MGNEGRICCNRHVTRVISVPPGNRQEAGREHEITATLQIAVDDGAVIGGRGLVLKGEGCVVIEHQTAQRTNFNVRRLKVRRVRIRRVIIEHQTTGPNNLNVRRFVVSGVDESTCHLKTVFTERTAHCIERGPLINSRQTTVVVLCFKLDVPTVNTQIAVPGNGRGERVFGSSRSVVRSSERERLSVVDVNLLELVCNTDIRPVFTEAGTKIVRSGCDGHSVFNNGYVTTAQTTVTQIDVHCSDTAFDRVVRLNDRDDQVTLIGEENVVRRKRLRTRIAQIDFTDLSLQRTARDLQTVEMQIVVGNLLPRRDRTEIND